MDCESLFLKYVSVKKGNFDREVVVKIMLKSYLKKRRIKYFNARVMWFLCFVDLFMKKRKLRTVSFFVLNFLWGSVFYFFGCC